MAAGAGAGTHPLYLPGKVYLAGPYRGAPLSLVFIIPAVSGAYDLGNVVVRAALHVDPETAQVTAVSDPLPQILDGIPLRTAPDPASTSTAPASPSTRPTANPSRSAPRSSATKAPSPTSRSHFQVANCASLPFAPKLALKLTGSTKQAGNPALTATLSPPSPAKPTFPAPRSPCPAPS